METPSPSWSRRKFVQTLSVGSTALFLYPNMTWSQGKMDPKVIKIVAKCIGIDTHNHVDVPFSMEEFKGQKYDLAGEIKKSGLAAICMTFQVDRPDLTEEGQAYERLMTCLDEMDMMLKENAMQRALNFSDLEKAYKENKPIVIQSVEGGHFIEGKMDRLQTAYDRGLRHLGLLHDNPSFVPLGDIYTRPAQYGGLTEFGIKVVKECNEMGILVDLTHASDDAIKDALAVATQPVLISHTGLDTQLGNNEKMAKMMMPRLISKQQARIVADAGGVIGVWTHLAETPLDYAKNIRAMVDVVGVDHVCIGTDTKMAQPANSKSRFGQKTNKAWDNQEEGFFYSVVEALLAVGFDEDEIIKIGGANYCRIFDEVTKHRG